MFSDEAAERTMEVLRGRGLDTSVQVGLVTGTGLTNIANLTSAATTISHFSQPLGKLTQAEKERLLKIGACFRCRRRGHRAVECRAGQTLNNLETDNQSNDSGKDQGGM